MARPYTVIPMERLRTLLRYDPASGRLFWQPRGRRCLDKRIVGKEALASVSTSGYMHGDCDGRQVKAHRAAWALYYGEWPSGDIDHIDGDPTNNRIENLRVVTLVEQGRNRAIPSHNKSGKVGVIYNKRYRTWMVTLCSKYVGSSKSLEGAISMRKTAEERAGFHPNHGRQKPPLSRRPDRVR